MAEPRPRRVDQRASVVLGAAAVSVDHVQHAAGARGVSAGGHCPVVRRHRLAGSNGDAVSPSFRLARRRRPAVVPMMREPHHPHFARLAGDDEWALDVIEQPHAFRDRVHARGRSICRGGARRAAVSTQTRSDRARSALARRRPCRSRRRRRASRRRGRCRSARQARVRQARRPLPPCAASRPAAIESPGSSSRCCIA